MAFSLSFSPEFFYATGEPYDRADLALNADGNPYSVYSALCLMQAKDKRAWNRMARDVFGCPGTQLQPETVMDRIHETDTCGDLTPPVDVWVDSDGYHRVEVYDASHYSYGSGMSGCLYDNQGTARTKDDAIEAALFIFKEEMSKREYKRAVAALRADGIYRFDRPGEVGAQYVEVSEQRGECPDNE